MIGGLPGLSVVVLFPERSVDLRYFCRGDLFGNIVDGSFSPLPLLHHVSHDNTCECVDLQVGPPPGGPPFVLMHVPVVFFTAKGIPGEVDERLETKDGILAASTRALTRGKGITLDRFMDLSV